MTYDVSRNWHRAVAAAVNWHPDLQRKAFRRVSAGFWTIRRNVLLEQYSCDEAVVVGLLVEIRDRQSGGHIGDCIQVPSRQMKEERYFAPSQLVWRCAPWAWQMFATHDPQVDEILRILLDGPGSGLDQAAASGPIERAEVGRVIHALSDAGAADAWL